MAGQKGSGSKRFSWTARLVPAVVWLAAAIFFPGPGVGSDSCPAMTAEEVYARLKKETLSHNTYTAVFEHRTERGANHEVWARGRVSGRYIQGPGKWCETRLEFEASFPEQAGAAAVR